MAGFAGHRPDTEHLLVLEEIVVMIQNFGLIHRGKGTQVLVEAKTAPVVPEFRHLAGSDVLIYQPEIPKFSAAGRREGSSGPGLPRHQFVFAVSNKGETGMTLCTSATNGWLKTQKSACSTWCFTVVKPGLCFDVTSPIASFAFFVLRNPQVRTGRHLFGDVDLPFPSQKYNLMILAKIRTKRVREREREREAEGGKAESQFMPGHELSFAKN